MKAWINGICDEVDRFTAQQTEYQKLLTQWRALEPRYLEILASLPEEDAELLREYEYLFSEMEYLKRIPIRLPTKIAQNSALSIQH